MSSSVSRVSWVLLLLALVVPTASVIAQEQDAAGERAWMGLYIRDVDREDIQALDLKRNTRGVVVSGVDDDGPASRAGIEPGDVITSFDGRKIRDRDAFMDALASRRAGDRVRLAVLREADERTYEFELEPRPQVLERFFPRNLGGSTGTRGRWNQNSIRFRTGGAQLGVMTLDLESNELGAYFGVDAGQGVLVTGVVEDGGAAAAGLQPGDVIVAVNDAKVGSTDQLRESLADFDNGETVKVRVMRQKRERSFDVELSAGFDLTRLNLPRGFSTSHRLDDDLGDLRREIRDLKRELRQLEREMRSGRGR